MPWRRKENPWYWLHRICKFVSYTGRTSTTCVMLVWRNDFNCRGIFYVPYDQCSTSMVNMCQNMIAYISRTVMPVKHACFLYPIFIRKQIDCTLDLSLWCLHWFTNINDTYNMGSHCCFWTMMTLPIVFQSVYKTRTTQIPPSIIMVRKSDAQREAELPYERVVARPATAPERKTVNFHSATII